MARQSLTSLIGIGIAAGALIATIGMGAASADEEHGRGRALGHADDAVATATLTPTGDATATPVSPQPSPTPVSPQPSPTAVSPQPTPTPHEVSDESLEHRHGIAGQVTAVSGSGNTGSLTIQTEDGLVATIQVTADTELWGQGHDALTLADIAVGDFVNVQGEPTATAGDNTIVANKIEVHSARSDDASAASAARNDDGAADDNGQGNQGNQGNQSDHGNNGQHGEGGHGDD